MPDSTFLDWPFFDEPHRALARDLRAWAEREVAPLCEHEPHDEAGLDALAGKFVRMLGDAGWLAPVGTLDVRALALSREILAYHGGLADFAFAMQGLGSASITLFGSDAQRKHYIPDVVAGRRVAAFAISEPEGGSDVAAMKTTARRDGDAYVIDGTKTWISNAGLADQYVLFARTGEAPGAKGLSAFVVDAATPGLRVSQRINVIAPHPLGTLSFENCRVPAANLIGAPGEGFKVAMGTLDVFRTTVGAAALGMARRALDEAVARARSRRAFGQAIGEFQLIQEKIADMAVRIDAAALFVYRSAWTKDVQKARVTRESSMAKLYATEEAQKVIDAAVQIWGGYGVISGAVVEQLYREIRALRIYEGTSEIQKLVIAGQVMKAN